MCLSDTDKHKETMKGVERESGAVPESVMDAVNQTLANVEEVQSHLHEFLSLSDPEVLTKMPPLQRAQSLFLLAKITSALYACKSSYGRQSLFFSFYFLRENKNHWITSSSLIPLEVIVIFVSSLISSEVEV